MVDGSLQLSRASSNAGYHCNFLGYTPTRLPDRSISSLARTSIQHELGTQFSTLDVDAWKNKQALDAQLGSFQEMKIGWERS